MWEFDEKFDIWFNEDAIAQTFSSYTQFDCEGYALSDTFYRIEVELLVLSYVQFYLGSHFPSWALAAHLIGKMNHLKKLYVVHII